jgi:hypothetical protein
MDLFLTHSAMQKGACAQHEETEDEGDEDTYNGSDEQPSTSGMEAFCTASSPDSL